MQQLRQGELLHGLLAWQIELTLVGFSLDIKSYPYSTILSPLLQYYQAPTPAGLDSTYLLKLVLIFPLLQQALIPAVLGPITITRFTI